MLLRPSLRLASRCQATAAKIFESPQAYQNCVNEIQKEIQGLKDAGTYKNERVIVGRQGKYSLITG